MPCALSFARRGRAKPVERFARFARGIDSAIRAVRYTMSLSACIAARAKERRLRMQNDAAQETMTVYPQKEEMRAERRARGGAFFAGIDRTLRARGAPMARVLCALMMALLTGARLPGGGFACQAAMFAALLRMGFAVPPAFAGVAAGFVFSYMAGDLACCWQLPCCAALWLTSCLWDAGVGRMALAVFLLGLTSGTVTGYDTPQAALTLLLTAAAGAGLSVLYDGAATCLSHREELDGETRPLCVLAVCASLTAGLLALPGGEALACAFAAYLTLEHAYGGGGQQALLCAGVVGGAAALGTARVHPLAMLLCGGFLAGEIKTRSRVICALLMLLGEAAAGALLGGDARAVRALLFTLPGMLPFLLLSPRVRAAVTNLVEQDAHEEPTQSEAVGLRCAGMINAWARLYDDTARVMEGLCQAQEQDEGARQCVALLRRTSTAAHQVLERTLGEIRPDDAAFRRVRQALLRQGAQEVRPAYALRVCGRLEAMLLKPEHVAPVTLEPLVSKACGVPMAVAQREGLLCTQALFEQRPGLALEVGAALRSRSGEEVAGDSYLSRALPGGRHVLALSDGMGSGVLARQESHAALELMLESLNAGYTRAQALDVVNDLMLLCTGREMYATMDLCVIDLHTGETAFEKLGACASYMVRGDQVRDAGAQTLPLGVLPDVEARSLRMTLEPGDVVVMMTDGVAEAYPGGEEALCEALRKLAWLHPQAVGEKLIAAVLAQGEPRDDMAVLCARVTRAAFA